MIWMPKKYRDSFVSVSFSPDQLVLCAVKKIDSRLTSHFFELTALTTIPFTLDEYDEGRICNPTAIKNYILTFISRHKKQSAPLTFTLNGNHIAEKIVSCDTTSPDKALFTNDTKNYIVDSCYLYPESNNTYAFYTATIERTLMVQYQLIAIASKLNVRALSTISMAHLNLYRFLQGASFSPHVLATLLRNTSNSTASLVPDHCIEKIIHINSSVKSSTNQNEHLRVALGAIIMMDT